MAATRFLLLLAPTLPRLASAGTFTVYTQPVSLRPGEVHNDYMDAVDMPPEIVEKYHGKDLAINSFAMDIVDVDAESGVERSVPLYEMYNHHYLVHAGSREEMKRLRLAPKGGCHQSAPVKAGMKSRTSFGGGTGAEFRGYPSVIPKHYAQKLRSPQSVLPLLHVINVQQNASQLECPCTSARHFDLKKGTIDGEEPIPFDCNHALRTQHNPSCELATYVGGLRCCEHGVFVTEHPDLQAPYHTVRVKITFGYIDDEEEAAAAVTIRGAHCCDVTGYKYHNAEFHGKGFAGGGGNIEYDVPRCPAGTPPERCVHVATNVQTIDYLPDNFDDPNEPLELVGATGHVHKAAISLDLIDERTGQVICRSELSYGRGQSAGDEDGFLVGIKPCLFGQPPLQAPPRFRRGDLVRTIATYNATEPHTGVMSLWFLRVAPITSKSGTDILV